MQRKPPFARDQLLQETIFYEHGNIIVKQKLPALIWHDISGISSDNPNFQATRDELTR